MVSRGYNMEWALALTTVPSGPCFHFRVRARSQGSRARRIPRDGVRAFKAVVVFHASRRRVLAQRGIPTAHYSHLSLSESWFFVLSDRSTRARSRSRYGRTDGLGVTRAAKQLILEPNQTRNDIAIKLRETVSSYEEKTPS